MNTTYDLFSAPKNWEIVTAGLDIAHVFLPFPVFTFNEDSEGGKPGFRLACDSKTGTPERFTQAFFRKVGDKTPTFAEVMGSDLRLPIYDGSPNVMEMYAEAADVIRSYLVANRDVQRIEGKIKLPFHPHAARLNACFLPAEVPSVRPTTIQALQFPAAIDTSAKDDSLLVIYSPLSPWSVTNADGTALGVPK